MGEIAFAVIEIEGFHEYSVSQSAVKSAFTVDEIAYHPGSCRSTDNQFHVVTQSGPAVPEILKCGNKSGLCLVHPGKFINKNDFLPLREPLQLSCKRIERKNPAALHLYLLRFEAALKCSCEIYQLLLFGSIVHSGHIESEGIIADTPHKECFSDTPSAINSHKLRTLRIEALLQFQGLFFSSDKFRIHFFIKII